MNILILNGSPRPNGNTHVVLEAMQEQLKESHDVTLLNVCRMKLSGCLACNSCKRNGGHCICPDESDALIQQVAAADAVIFGTPVYWWGVSAQLKMAVDKLYSLSAEAQKKVRRLGVVAIGASGVDDIQYRLIHDQFACIAGNLHWEQAFYLPLSAYAPGEIADDREAMAQVREAASRL